MPKIIGFSPAKLNLMLNVTGRRADGYHLLQMLNTRLALGDKITLSYKESNSVQIGLSGTSAPWVRADKDLWSTNANLVARAIQLYCHKTGLTGHFTVSIVKQIPVGGGLAGGSSNAACTLRMVNSLAQAANLTNAELAAISLELGADVPFFLFNASCLVEGVGENCSAIKLDRLPGLKCVLILPNFGVNTAAVFGQFKCSDYAFSEPIKSIQAQEIMDDVRRFDQPRLATNALIAAATQIEPRLTDMLRRLAEIAPGLYGMTGSGSTLFALGASEGRLLEIAKIRFADATVLQTTFMGTRSQ